MCLLFPRKLWNLKNYLIGKGNLFFTVFGEKFCDSFFKDVLLQVSQCSLLCLTEFALFQLKLRWGIIYKWRHENLKIFWPLSPKLMRLGIANQIVVVKSNPKSEFDRRLMTIRIPTIKIESTIAMLIQNRSIFDINR